MLQFVVPVALGTALKYISGSFIMRFLFKAAIFYLILDLMSKSTKYITDKIDLAYTLLPPTMYELISYFGIFAGFSVFFSIIMTGITYKFFISYLRSF